MLFEGSFGHILFSVALFNFRKFLFLFCTKSQELVLLGVDGRAWCSFESMVAVACSHLSSLIVEGSKYCVMFKIPV